MTTYAFRIWCRLAGCHIKTIESKMSFSLPETPLIHVCVSEPKNQSDDHSLILWCSGFSSTTEAQAVGSQVKKAVMLAGLLLGAGFDVGTDQATGLTWKRKDGQPDDRIQTAVHGLHVVPDVEGMQFWSGGVGRPEEVFSSDQLEKRIRESYKVGAALTPKQTLVAQLYAQSHFHPSDAARFLTLISAVEALAEQSIKSSAAVALLDHMMATVGTSELEEAERDSLTSGLRNLRQQSISGACRALVTHYCGAADAAAFRDAYDIRSKMLHRGEQPSRGDLEALCQQLDTLVRCLLSRHVSGRPASTMPS